MAPEYDIAIVGGGIVGSSLASLVAPHARVLLLDRALRQQRGSTGLAPGFVGVFNEIPELTELARRSVEVYRGVGGGFRPVGGLEVARTQTEKEAMLLRAAAAKKQGVEANVLSPEAAARLAPAFVTPEHTAAALHFPGDGTADGPAIALCAQDVAAAAGATLLDADVVAITGAGPYVLATSQGEVHAKTVVLCTGVWAGQLVPSLSSAAVSVSHPYILSAPREKRADSPFVRWPAAHVYARDHGARDGVGSYAHEPVHVRAKDMASRGDATASDPAFGGAISEAVGFLPPSTAAGFADAEVHSSGVFTVTPDGLPLVGRLGAGKYAAVGVWITHAAGCAGVLADMVLADLGLGGGGGDAGLRAALDPRRFEGHSGEELEKQALDRYNNIYNTEKE